MNQSGQATHRRIKGVVYVFKNLLSLKMLNIHYLQESIRFELQVVSKTCRFLSPYRSSTEKIYR